MLKGAYKTQRMDSASSELYHKCGSEFLSNIVQVIVDETRASYVNAETKE